MIQFPGGEAGTLQKRPRLISQERIDQLTAQAGVSNARARRMEKAAETRLTFLLGTACLELMGRRPKLRAAVLEVLDKQLFDGALHLGVAELTLGLALELRLLEPDADDGG